MSSARRVVSAGAIVTLAAATALAQSPALRGEVVHADGRTPATSVLIEVVDGQSGVAGRTLTGATGRFSVLLSAPGTYTVRALRVGYRPTVLRDVAVPDSGTSVRLTLEEMTIRLTAARVTTDDKCGVRSNDGGLIATAWEEVRKALASTDAAGSRREFEADVTNWYSVHAPNGDGPIFQEFSRRRLDSPKPYVGVSGADVQRDGYARPAPGGAVDYLGPDAETLTSDAFATSHCFRLVPPQPGRPWLGVAFRPPSSRVGYAIVEIEGTFWIDTATAALRLLEYRYTNAPPAFSRVGAGGRIEFDQLATGAWIIRRWTIRLASEVAQRTGSAVGRTGATPYVAVSGGTVTSLRGDTTQLLAPPAREWRATLVQADETADLDFGTVEFADGGHFAAIDARNVAVVAEPPAGRNVVLASTAVMRALMLPPLRVPVDVGATGGDATIRIPGMVELLRQRCGSGTESRRESAVYGALQIGARRLESTDVISVAWLKDSERGAAAGQKWRADSTMLDAGRGLDSYGEAASPDTFGRWVACGVPRASSVRVVVLDAQQRVAGVAFGRVAPDQRISEIGTLVIAGRPE